jgi:NADPH:quinone reductase-like Zn-dependent oxidoreductase
MRSITRPGFRRGGEGDHRRQGVNLVLDMVGGDYLPRNLACLAEDGRHVSIAVQRGAKASCRSMSCDAPRLTLTGSTLRGRSVEFKTAVRDTLTHAVWPLLAAGRLKPVIDGTFPLADAAAAHARMEEWRRSHGAPSSRSGLRKAQGRRPAGSVGGDRRTR